MIDINILDRQTRTASILHNDQLLARLSKSKADDLKEQAAERMMERVAQHLEQNLKLVEATEPAEPAEDSCPLCGCSAVVHVYGLDADKHHCRVCNFEWRNGKTTPLSVAVAKRRHAC